MGCSASHGRPSHTMCRPERQSRWLARKRTRPGAGIRSTPDTVRCAYRTAAGRKRLASRHDGDFHAFCSPRRMIQLSAKRRITAASRPCVSIGYTHFVRSRFASRARRAGFGTGNSMLPDFRFVIVAAVVIALLGMTGLTLFASTRLSQHAKMGPLETARNLAFTDHAEWNQFYDADSVRRFVSLGRKAEAAAAADVAPDRPTEVAVNDELATAILPLEAHEAGGGDETMPVVAARFAVEEKGAAIAVAPPRAPLPTLAVPSPAPPQVPNERPGGRDCKPGGRQRRAHADLEHRHRNYRRKSRRGGVDAVDRTDVVRIDGGGRTATCGRSRSRG
jgi:hypothetical protein